MAQLVKLLDYVSRYENDLTRYPTQFIRLKRSQWERMKIQWETGLEHSMWEDKIEDEELEENKGLTSFFRFFRKKKVDTEELADGGTNTQDDFGFHSNITYTPKTEKQLRNLYVDQLFHFQIKWASSTLIDKSRVDNKFMRDSLLRSFTQELPDSFLLFYYPIIKLQKAPVELSIIIMTPIECMCITVLEKEDSAAFVGGSDRFWKKKTGNKETKLLNPLIALNRDENIISRIFHEKGIDFPIRKYLISRNGYIDHPNIAFDVEIIDKRTYDKWFSSLRKYTTPMKMTQFRASQAILDVGQTTAMSHFYEFAKDDEDIEEGE